jgi:hypothetical protein
MISGNIAALPELTSLAGSGESPRSALIPSESTELLTAGSEIEIFLSKKLLPAEICCLSSARDFLHRDPGPGLLVVGDAAHGCVDDGLPHVCWGPVGGVSFRNLVGEDEMIPAPPPIPLTCQRGTPLLCPMTAPPSSPSPCTC